MRIAAFLSSDEAHLYKIDIFRALALPVDYSLHFRYPKRYIDPVYLSNLDLLKKEQCGIFYLAGLPSKYQGIFSIRKVIVENYLISEETGLVNFSLRLKDFADFKIVDKSEKEKVEGRYFVSSFEVEKVSKNRWIDRVEAVRNYFNENLFFNFQPIS